MNFSNVSVAVLTTLHRGDNLDYADLALNSILEQDCDNEIRIYICVDGPVPPKHETWLQKNSNRFRKVIRNQTRNLGLAKSLNRLIDEALEDEEFIFRMDLDDISVKNRFSKQIQFMEENPEISLSGAQVIDVDANAKIKRIREFPTDHHDIIRALGRICPVSHPTFCFRKNVLKDVNVRYPDKHLSEDLAILVLLANNGYVLANHCDPLLHWRQGDNFYARRRDLKRGLREFGLHLKHLRLSNRIISLDLLLIIAKFGLRLLPSKLIKIVHESNIRHYFLKK